MIRTKLACGWLAVASYIAVWFAVSAPTYAADDALEAFVEGLRQRRLFGLANEYCRRQLAAPKLDPLVRGRVTVEWLRVLAEQAAQSAPDQRRELTSRAHQLAANFVRDDADHPRAFLVRTQDALGVLAIGEVLRREAELIESARTTSGPAAPTDVPPDSAEGKGAADRSTYDEARGLLRDGMRLAEQLDRDLTQLIPQRFRRPAPPPALSAEELTALQTNLRFQLARAQRQLALCYPAATPDRSGALANALLVVEKTLSPLPSDEPLAPRLQLERAILLRLLDRRPAVDEALAEAAWKDAPPELRMAARAERIRWLLDTDRLREALEVVELTPDAGEEHSAELDFARYETYLAAWRAAEAADKTVEARRYEGAAVAVLERIDRQYGPAWRRRGDLLLVRAATTGRGPRSRAALRRTGDTFYRQDRLDDALAAYDQAAAQANADGDADESFSLRFKGALVEQKRSRHVSASARLAELATGAPKHPQAAAAHQLAAWNLAQAIRTAGPTDQAPLAADYLALLEQQLQQWPDAEPTQEARLWLGRWYESRREWGPATEAYRKVDSAAAQFPAALEGTGRAWLARIDELRGDPTARRKEAESAGQFFEQAAYGGGAERSEQWSASQRGAALIAARAWLDPGLTQFARVERLLRTAIERSVEAPETWRAAARALLLVALAGQETRQAEANELVGQLGKLPPAEIADAVVRLGALRTASGGESRSRLAKLELQLMTNVTDRLPELPEATRWKLETLRAAAYVAAGQRAEGLAAYRALAVARPADGGVQEALAELLLSGDDAAEWRAALDQWRRVVAKSPARGARWYRGKYGVALAEYKLGNRKGAAQLIRFLQATPPGLADTPLEPQFVELLRRSEGG